MKQPSLPAQLLIVIALTLLFGNRINTYTAQLFYTFSLLFKELLAAFLPAIVFSFILVGIVSFKKNAPFVIGILLTLIITSNVCVSLISFLIGRSLLPLLTTAHAINLPTTSSSGIQPLFTITIPSIIGSEKAMLAALVIGILLSLHTAPQLQAILLQFKRLVEQILNKLFIPLLPLYVIGFLIKLVQEGTLYTLFSSYGKTFIVVLCIQSCFIMTAYLIAARFNFITMLQKLKTAFASYLTAFSTMSSTATIPVTIRTATKNTENSTLPHIAIPIMANVHLMGDAVTVPLFALTTLAMFHGAIPGIAQFIHFIAYFCLAMLATSGVPGGGIIVIIPLLKSLLGFSPEMVSLITALYLLQDSFGTACNVLGDGALTIIAQNILSKFNIIKH